MSGWQTASCNIGQHEHCPQPQHNFCNCRCHKVWRRVLRALRRAMRKKKSLALLMAVLAVITLGLAAGCKSKADVASHNLSKAADQFEIQRRIVFFNGITDKYLLTIEGRCSLGNDDPSNELSVTCEVAPGQYEKHFLGLSDNVSYFVQQEVPAAVSVYHYRVLFRPTEIIPDLDADVNDQSSTTGPSKVQETPAPTPAPSKK